MYNLKKQGEIVDDFLDTVEQFNSTDSNIEQIRILINAAHEYYLDILLKYGVLNIRTKLEVLRNLGFLKSRVKYIAKMEDAAREAREMTGLYEVRKEHLKLLLDELTEWVIEEIQK